MIDFFHKGASMTKRITGVAKLKGAPVVNARPLRKITRVGTFYDEEDAIQSVLLEVADTPETRKAGLMGRDNVPEIYGMLFEGLSGGGFFWMKNCLVPIDVAFLDKDGFVCQTYAMKVDKEGNEHYDYGDDVVAAVELHGGFLKKFGIVNGFTFETRELSKEAANG
ncbi:MAG: DUF192 domain-containing protein [Kiritimatiellae bacterium]|nr:DUF192 domain-containing protein [Kiritimatiellia bacterium]